jgi:hypothetical protein
MKCLLLYYSFTGQASRAVDAAAEACRTAGWAAVTCRVDFSDAANQLRRPLSISDVKRWTAAASQGVSMPIACDPPGALQTEYDLVCIFSNTWQSHPCVPIKSFLEGADARRLLAGKPFAVYIVCRRLWEKNLEIVRAMAEAAGGKFIDGKAFTHPGGQLGSLIQTTSFVMRKGAGWKRFFGLPLPKFGLSDEMIAAAGTFTREVLARIKARRP